MPESEKPKPLVIESFRHVRHNKVRYTRRLRISPYTAQKIDKGLGTSIHHNNGDRFIVLTSSEAERICKILDIEFKIENTYLHIDPEMESFK